MEAMDTQAEGHRQESEERDPGVRWVASLMWELFLQRSREMSLDLKHKSPPWPLTKCLENPRFAVLTLSQRFSLKTLGELISF